MLGRAVAVLAAANLLNNRIAPRWAPLTSAIAAGALLALARRAGLTARELGFADAGRGARLGGLLAAAVAAGYGAAVAWPRTRPLCRDARALRLSRARLLEEALLQVPVGTVLLEEVGFRGVLYGLLARAYGPRAATAGSALLFGLWHVLPALDLAAANPALNGLARGALPESPGGALPESPQDALPASPGGGTTGDGTADRAAPTTAAGTVRLVAGTVLAATLAGAFCCALRRRGGLLAPALLHTATNSLGYAAAVTARALDARSAPASPAPP